MAMMIVLYNEQQPCAGIHQITGRRRQFSRRWRSISRATKWNRY